jgi:hypothetical protein
MTTDLYGFKTTEDVQYDAQGLPIGTYKVLIANEEAGETKKESNPNPLIVTFEVLEGEFKGKEGRVWYNVHNTDVKTANIAKQNIKRIADATGKPVTPTSPLKNRVLTIEVRAQKKDTRYTEIARYLSEDYTPSEDAPF